MIARERKSTIEGTPASHRTESPPRLRSTIAPGPGVDTMSVEGERTEKCDGSRERVDEVVTQFHVHYEVYAESMAMRDHSIRQVGFCVELHARVGGESGVRLGDDQCREAIIGLLEVSSFLVPAAEGDCCYDVDGSPFALCYHGSPQEGQGCVRLDIRVRRRDGWNRPVNGMDARALQEMEHRLRALGVPRAYA